MKLDKSGCHLVQSAVVPKLKGSGHCSEEEGLKSRGPIACNALLLWQHVSAVLCVGHRQSLSPAGAHPQSIVSVLHARHGDHLCHRDPCLCLCRLHPHLAYDPCLPPSVGRHLLHECFHRHCFHEKKTFRRAHTVDGSAWSAPGNPAPSKPVQDHASFQAEKSPACGGLRPYLPCASREPSRPVVATESTKCRR